MGRCDAIASFCRSLVASSTASILTVPKSTPGPVWRFVKIGLEPAVALIGASSDSPAKHDHFQMHLIGLTAAASPQQLQCLVMMSNVGSRLQVGPRPFSLS